MRGLRLVSLSWALALCACFSDGSDNDDASTADGGSSGNATTGPTTTSPPTSTGTGTTTDMPTGTTGSTGGDSGTAGDMCDPAVWCPATAILCEDFEVWGADPPPPWVLNTQGNTQPPAFQRDGASPCGAAVETRVASGDLFSILIAPFAPGALPQTVTIQTDVFLDPNAPMGAGVRVLQFQLRDPNPMGGPEQWFAVDLFVNDIGGGNVQLSDTMQVSFPMLTVPVPLGQWFELRLDVDFLPQSPLVTLSFDGQEALSATAPPPAGGGFAAASAQVVVGPFTGDTFMGDYFQQFDQVWVAPTP